MVNSPAWRISNVQVIGAHYLTSAQIVTAARIVGDSPFAIPNQTVDRRVLALGVPETVSVFYQLPNTAVISVSERRPAYIWKVDPTLYLVARDGTILGTTQTATLSTLVVDVDHKPVKVGQRIDPLVLQQAETVLAVLPRIISPAPDYLLHSQELGLIIPTGAIPEVVLGDGNLNAKLTILRPVLQAALGAHPIPRLVDLRVPSHPYYR